VKKHFIPALSPQRGSKLLQMRHEQLGAADWNIAQLFDYSGENATLLHSSSNDGGDDRRKSPTFLQKTPTFFRKSPTFFGKSPTFLQLGPKLGGIVRKNV